MNILYANVIEQNSGWGAEWFLNQSFQKLGHSTTCIDYRQNRHHLFSPFRSSSESHIFFLQRGDNFPTHLVNLIQLPRIFYASELLSRCHDHDQLLSSGLFDHIFVRSQSCWETMIKRGWSTPDYCSILLSSFDETIFRPMPDIQKDIDILFIGNLTPRRERVLQEIQEHYPVIVASAYGVEMARWLNRARIVLNLHADEFLDTETRVFEALGCRAFLLSEALSSENPFTYQDLMEAQDLSDLIDKIGFYLQHPKEREAIATAGYQSAREAHTYTHRAQELTDCFSSLITGRTDLPRRPVQPGLALEVFHLSELIQRGEASAQQKMRAVKRTLFPKRQAV